MTFTAHPLPRGDAPAAVPRRQRIFFEVPERFIRRQLVAGPAPDARGKKDVEELSNKLGQAWPTS